jgi:biotin synthase
MSAISPIDISQSTFIRHDWQLEEVQALQALPFNDLLFKAQSVHRAFFDPNCVQLSTLVNIKSGACSEDCGYCSQSARYKTDVDVEPLMEVTEVLRLAAKARENGATRFCMGAAWRGLKDRNIQPIVEMISTVKDLGMETCMTLGMLTDEQAAVLKEAGLDYYNHNLDTSEEYYPQVVSTRSYQDRLDTLESVRNAGIKVCSGGILGLGEEQVDRCKLLITLANMEKHPESVPINLLVQIEGTPLFGSDNTDPLDVVRTIAMARIMMPESYVRLSAGRSSMSDEQQALCFHAGANSIFYGEKLLTTENPELEKDRALFARLGIHPQH